MPAWPRPSWARRVGLIHAIEPAAAILERMVSEAEALLKGGAKFVR